MTRIARIFTDLCVSVSSAQSVFYRNPVIIYDDKKPQMNADKRRFVAINHRKIREERKAENQISLCSGMKIINRIYRTDRMVE